MPIGAAFSTYFGRHFFHFWYQVEDVSTIINSGLLKLLFRCFGLWAAQVDIQWMFETTNLRNVHVQVMPGVYLLPIFLLTISHYETVETAEACVCLFAISITLSEALQIGRSDHLVSTASSLRLAPSAPALSRVDHRSV